MEDQQQMMTQHNPRKEALMSQIIKNKRLLHLSYDNIIAEGTESFTQRLLEYLKRLEKLRVYKISKRTSVTTEKGSRIPREVTTQETFSHAELRSMCTNIPSNVSTSSQNSATPQISSTSETTEYPANENEDSTSQDSDYSTPQHADDSDADVIYIETVINSTIKETHTSGACVNSDPNKQQLDKEGKKAINSIENLKKSNVGEKFHINLDNAGNGLDPNYDERGQTFDTNSDYFCIRRCRTLKDHEMTTINRFVEEMFSVEHKYDFVPIKEKKEKNTWHIYLLETNLDGIFAEIRDVDLRYYKAFLIEENISFVEINIYEYLVKRGHIKRHVAIDSFKRGISNIIVSMNHFYYVVDPIACFRDYINKYVTRKNRAAGMQSTNVIVRKGASSTPENNVNTKKSASTPSTSSKTNQAEMVIEQYPSNARRNDLASGPSKNLYGQSNSSLVQQNVDKNKSKKDNGDSAKTSVKKSKNVNEDGSVIRDDSGSEVNEANANKQKADLGLKETSGRENVDDSVSHDVSPSSAYNAFKDIEESEMQEHYDNSKGHRRTETQKSNYEDISDDDTNDNDSNINEERNMKTSGSQKHDDTDSHKQENTSNYENKSDENTNGNGPIINEAENMKSLGNQKHDTDTDTQENVCNSFVKNISDTDDNSDSAKLDVNDSNKNEDCERKIEIFDRYYSDLEGKEEVHRASSSVTSPPETGDGGTHDPADDIPNMRNSEMRQDHVAGSSEQKSDNTSDSANENVSDQASDHNAATDAESNTANAHDEVENSQNFDNTNHTGVDLSASVCYTDQVEIHFDSNFGNTEANFENDSVLAVYKNNDSEHINSEIADITDETDSNENISDQCKELMIAKLVKVETAQDENISNSEEVVKHLRNDEQIGEDNANVVASQSSCKRRRLDNDPNWVGSERNPDENVTSSSTNYTLHETA